MTFGQLRLQLQAAAPGVSLDLLDEFLNTRYSQLLEATDWQGLKYHFTLQTQAAHESSTDTVTLTVGSNSVVGVSTGFTAQQLTNTPRFYRPGDSVIYIATYVDATHLTLDRPYEGNGVDAAGTAYSAAPYVLMQNIYALPSDARSLVSILEPVTGRPLHLMSKDELDQAAGPRTHIDNPVYAAPYDDVPETSPPVIRQIELFPPPRWSRGFVVEYVHSAALFDGTNTAASPLPWVSDTILLMGCRADIAAHLGNGPQLAYYEAKFEREVNSLLLLEHAQKRVKVGMKMAARFTRHRGARAARTFGRNWGIGAGGPY